MRGVFIHKNILGWYAGLCLLALVGVLADGTYVSRRARARRHGRRRPLPRASTSMTGLSRRHRGVALAVLHRPSPAPRASDARCSSSSSCRPSSSSAWLSPSSWCPRSRLGKDATLTGRVPLWRLVDAEIGRHLILGFGYQAFWTEANPDAWRSWTKVGWQAPHAHSGFRDVLLNFGLVGFLVLVATVVRAMRQGAALHCAPARGGLAVAQPRSSAGSWC